MQPEGVPVPADEESPEEFELNGDAVVDPVTTPKGDGVPLSPISTKAVCDSGAGGAHDEIVSPDTKNRTNVRRISGSRLGVWDSMIQPSTLTTTTTAFSKRGQ